MFYALVAVCASGYAWLRESLYFCKKTRAMNGLAEQKLEFIQEVSHISDEETLAALREAYR